MYRFLFIFWTTIVLSSSSTFAWDPFGLKNTGSDAAKEIRAAVNEAFIAAQVLQNEMDADIQKYMQNISNLYDRANVNLNQTISSSIELASAETKAVSDHIFSKLNDTIDNIDCVVDESIEVSLRQTLVTGLSLLTSAKMQLELPFGYKRDLLFRKKPLVLEINIARVTDTNDIFDRIHKAYIDNFALMTDNDSIVKLLNAYGNISKLALKSRCFAGETVLRHKYNKLHMHYEAKLLPWNNMSINFIPK